MASTGGEGSVFTLHTPPAVPLSHEDNPRGKDCAVGLGCESRGLPVSCNGWLSVFGLVNAFLQRKSWV